MKQKEKTFKMPHLLWLMLGLLLFACLLTYIVPAGEFATDANGKILGDQFSFLDGQTPISPLKMLMMLLTGLTNSGSVIWVVLVSGAMTGLVLATGAIDELINWAIYKLKDKDERILISGLYILMVYLGAFGGSDALVALIPIGLIFTKKMKLDPICAIGVTTYATSIGFSCGPTKQSVAQMLMGVRVYGAFFTMFIFMNIFMVLGLIFLLNYTKKIKKDPTKSLMYSEGWRPDSSAPSDAELASIGSSSLSVRSILILVLFFGQYLVLTAYSLMGGKQMYPLIVAMGLVISILCGLIAGFSCDRIGKEFSAGMGKMVFIGFAIGMAQLMSLVLTNGHTIHTIVFALTRPLMGLPRSVTSVGMTAVISVINLLIPSASSKASILIPVIKPMAETLNMNLELAVQAYQFGDGFTNMLSPVLALTVGSCATAGVPFPKWFQWIFPKVIAFLLVSFVLMVILTESGWTAF